MENKKQFIINMIAQIIAFMVNGCISFFLTPYIVNAIGVEANGFVSLANEFVQYAQLLTVSLNSMAGRFITIRMHKKDKEGAVEYFSSIFIANLLLSTFLCVIFILIICYLEKLVNVSTDIVGDVKFLWTFVFTNFILSIFSSIYSTSTFIKNRLDLSALANIISYIIKGTILIIAYVILKSKVVWIIGLATLGSGLFNLLSNIYYKNKLTKELKIDKSRFNLNKIKELFMSGIWNTVSKLSSILSSGLSLLITNVFVNDFYMGILSLAKTIPHLILSLFAVLSNLFAPQLTMYYAKGDFEGMKKHLIMAIKILSVFSSIPIAVLLAFGKEFYALWAPTQDANLLYIVTIISCIELTFCLVLEPLYNIFTITNKVKNSSLFLLISSIASIITVFIGIIIIEDPIVRLLIIAGTSTFYSCIRVLLFLPMYGAKCIKSKITTFYPTILKSTLSTVILSIIGVVIKMNFKINTWLTLIIMVIAVGVSGIIVNYFLMFDKKDKRKLWNIIKRIKEKEDLTQ